MIQKALIGGLAAAVLALIVVFNLLLSSREANGQLAADLETAAETNAAQTEQIAILHRNAEMLIEQYELEQQRAAEFTEAVTAANQELERTKRDHAIELAGIRDSLTPEERVCAEQRVPDAYFGGMRGNGSSDADGVRGSASADPG